MRKLGIAVLICIGLLVVAALVAPHVIDVNKYRGQIQAQLEQKLGRKVTLGEMGLGLFPPSFHVNNVVIGEDPRFGGGRPFAQTQELAISVKLLPLLHKDVQVRSLELVRPQIELVRDAQGKWNFATLGQAPAPGATSTPPAAPSKPSPEPSKPEPGKAQPSGTEISLANLSIRDGQVGITDLQKRQPRAVYDHIDLSLNDFAPDKQFSLKAAAHLPGSGKQLVGIQGTAGPVQQSNMMNTQFNGKLNLEQVSISAVQKFMNSQALSGVEALVSGDANVRNENGNVASRGIIRLENPQINKINVGYPITLDYDVADDLNRDFIQIKKADLKLGATPLTLSGTLDARPTPSQLDVKLTASRASIAEAARLASAFGVAFGQGMNVTGSLDADVQARGPATKPAMNGRISLRDVSVSGKDLPQPVKVADLQLTLTPDAIRSNDFSATSGSTTVNVNFVLSQYTSDKPGLNAGLRAGNARVGELLSMARAYGVTAVEGISGDGLLNLDARAQGPAKNLSALIFSGTGKLQNASIKLPSLTAPVQVRNADLRFSQNSAVLSNLNAGLGQTNATGGLTLKDFSAPQVQFNLNADKVNVSELQQMMATPPASPARASSGGFWQLTPRAEAQSVARSQPSMLSKMTGAGTVSIGTVQYDELLLNNAHSNVTLDRGIIRLNPITADVYGGKENGNVTIDMRPAQPVYAVNLKTDKVDANKLISSVSSLKQALYGLLTANVNATFSSTTADSIARSLNGTLDMNLLNGKLMNVDLLHQLASVGKFVGGLPTVPQGFTNLMQLSGNFDIKNGVAQTNNLKAVIDGGTLAANGLVNLADQSLNMHVTAVLNKALSDKVGGTQVGGFMNTALANNQGELVIPVIVTGTFHQMQFAPDVEQIARMKLQNLLPTSKNPGVLGSILGNKGQNGTGQQKGGLGGILGALGGEQQNQQQNQSQGVSGNQGQTQPQTTQQPPQQKQNPVGDILNQVLGKKKKEQQPPPQQQSPPPAQNPPQ